MISCQGAPKASIVIVCMNRMDNLYPCLTSIREQVSVPAEVLVTAYLFSKENLEATKKDFPWVKFIKSNEPRGFSENNNLALRQAQGQYIFILNDDTELHEDVIAKLIADFEKLPENAAIVCPKLLNADGSLQLCGRPPYPARYYVLQQWHMHKEPIDDTPGKTAEFGEVFRTSNISGAAFLIKAGIFKKMGWFDETYFFTPEDIALSTLARRMGYGVYVDRAVSVTHKWRTTASKISTAVRPAAVRGSLIFFSGGRALKYVLIAVPVWMAEMSKRIKAAFRQTLHPSEENLIKLLTFRSITRAIFTTRTPKELFLREYAKLKK